MRFFNLREKPEYIPVVATWFHEEWAHLNPSRTYDDLINYIDEVINNNDHDQIFICINGETPVSSVSLRSREVDTNDQFSPWLSSLVVDKNHRKNGVGSQTVRLFENYCSKNNIKTIFLFTETDKLKEWYSKQDWMSLQTATFKGHEGFIMNKII